MSVSFKLPARGDFASVPDAVRQLIDERIAERAAEAHDGLDWATPFVDEAFAEVARGEMISKGEHRARTSLRLAGLKD